MDAKRIPYSNDPGVWHWSERNRPTHCASDLTIYTNTSGTGITVTPTGLESPISYRETFGADASKTDINFVISHTLHGYLQFNPPDCGMPNRHGVSIDHQRTDSPMKLYDLLTKAPRVTLCRSAPEMSSTSRRTPTTTAPCSSTSTPVCGSQVVASTLFPRTRRWLPTATAEFLT